MSDVRCNCLALRQAARKTTQLYDAALAPIGLRVTQYSILSQIGRERTGATISELAQEMVMDRATLGQNLRPLERDGLIRIGVGEDRRSRVVTLTAAGVARLKEGKTLWARAQRTFEKEMGEAYSERLRRDLGKVAGADFPGEAGVRAGAD